MINQLKSSATLLIFLGVLFSIPIIAKTLSAHGAVPALVTGFLVIALVFIGPISFVVAGAIETKFFIVSSIATDLEVILILIFGLVLFLAWLKLLVRGPGYPVPYLPVTGWALMGVYFCVLQIFTHIT
jgi:hypothetical protein